MGMVMIKCPNTSKPIPTGIGMDKASFEASNMSGNSVKCPKCGNIHIWDKRDAWVWEGPPQA